MQKFIPFILSKIINYNLLQIIFCSVFIVINLFIYYFLVLCQYSHTICLVCNSFVLCTIAHFFMLEISFTSFTSSFPISCDNVFGHGFAIFHPLTKKPHLHEKLNTRLLHLYYSLFPQNRYYFNQLGYQEEHICNVFYILSVYH